MTGGGGGVVEGGHSYILCLVLAVTAAFPMAVHGSAGACTHCTSPAHPHTHTEGQESQSHVLSYCFHRYDSNQRRSHERGTMEGYEEFGFPFKTVSSTARKGKEKNKSSHMGHLCVPLPIMNSPVREKPDTWIILVIVLGLTLLHQQHS